MYDTFDYTIRVALSQLVDKKPYVICYASHILNGAQLNYFFTKNEFLAMIFDFENFWSYLIGSHVISYIDHSIPKHPLSEKYAILLL